MGIHRFTSNDRNDPHAGRGGGAPHTGAGQPAGPGAGSHDDGGVLVDYNDRFGQAAPALFRDRLVQQALSVLIRSKKPNPLLVGPAGVGKTRIVEEVARLIATKDPGVPAQLRASTVWELPLGALVSGASVVGQLESRILGIVDFITDPANDAILFIDEVHLLARTNDPVYSKIAQLLKPAMARGDLRLCAATTAQEARSIEDDPAFARRFARLIVDELTAAQTVQVLQGALPNLEQHYRHQVQVPHDLLVEVVEVSEEFKRADQHRPDSALTLLDQAMAELLVNHQTAFARATSQGLLVNGPGSTTGPVVLGRDKLATVARRIASGNAEPPNSSGQALRDCFDSELQGQDRAVSQVCDTLRREALQLTHRNRPATWLFAGPSGVGKTQAAKIMAAHLTGQPPIVLNMAEYSAEHDQSKLLGSGPGYIGSDSNRELPFDTLESNPYRLLLLDELEKAHPHVHRLFLSALDEGWLRMASGKVIDFSKVVVVATTNAGAAELNGASVGFGSARHNPSPLSDAAVTAVLQRNGFAPEFLGRFEHVIPFDSLDLDIYTRILTLEVERLSANPMLANRGLVVPTVPQDELAVAAATSFDPARGARPAQRAAKALVEDFLLAANPLLTGP